MAGEDKERIVAFFARTLHATNTGVDDLSLSKDQKTVKIFYYGGGTQDVNVSCDSGIAIIRDICKHLD